MIGKKTFANGDTYVGVAPDAELDASALINIANLAQLTPKGMRESEILALKKVANPGGKAAPAAAINHSYGPLRGLFDPDNLDGSSSFARQVDHVVAANKTINVVSLVNEAKDVKRQGLTVTYNSIHVRSTQRPQGDAYFRATAMVDVSQHYKLADRSFVEILAPGVEIRTLAQAGNAQVPVKDVSGNSVAAPHVTGAIALLHEYVNISVPAASKTAAKNPYLMKAVILNSADKIKDRLPGPHPTPTKAGQEILMSRTVIDSDNKNRTWSDDPAADIIGDAKADERQSLALSATMGAGALNVKRAVAQLHGGQFAPGGNEVGVIGWDMNVLSRNKDPKPDPKTEIQNQDVRYKIYSLPKLALGSDLAVTLAWEREVVETPRMALIEDRYEVINGFRKADLGNDLKAAVDSLPRDLNLYLMPAGSKKLSDALWSSRSVAGNVEHFFLQLPAGKEFKDVKYELWVVGNMRDEAQGQAQTNKAGGIQQEYGLAWWGEEAAGGQEEEEESLIGDRVWVDTNANGSQDEGELGVRDVVVTLIDDNTQEVVDQTRTDYLGNYLFTGVQPGTYYLQFDAPAGYTFTTPHLGDAATDSDAQPEPGGRVAFTETITVSGAGERLDIDAGLTALPTGSVSGFLWSDDNEDGMQTSGEAGVSDVEVLLLNTSGEYVADTLTDEYGHYSFSGVSVGDYIVRFGSLTNHGYTTLDNGSDGTDSDADEETGWTAEFSVTDSQTSYLDAGYVVTAGSLAGWVWTDTDEDGVADAGESGASGVFVQVLDGSSDLVAETYTNEEGNYSFDGLAPGNYTLEFFTTAGETFSIGGPTQSITSTVGVLTQASDTGLIPPAPGSITGRAWSDTDEDGIQDVGESFFGGIAVDLYDEVGELVDSTTTSTTDGTYTFDDLAQGAYYVVVGGTNQLTDADVVSDDTVDSDFSWEWRTVLVDVLAGEATEDVDAGLLANHVPEGADNSYSVAHGGNTTLTISSGSGVLANDTDEDNDSLAAVLVDDVAYGELTLNSDGSFTYTPPDWYYGDVTFTYRPVDADGLGSLAMVTITVENDDPSAANDTSSTNEDSSVSVSVLANDSDPDSDTLTVIGAWDGDHGTVTFTGSSVTYKPDANWHGTDSFVYWVIDEYGGVDSATVTVTVNAVNDAPVANDDAAPITVNTPTVIAVRANDTDVDGDTLSVTAVGSAPHGVVSITGGGTGVSYTPTPNYVGSDSFTYTISDGHGGTATATVFVTVVLPSGDDVFTLHQGQTIDILAPGILVNDPKPNGFNLTVTSYTQLVAYGTGLDIVGDSLTVLSGGRMQYRAGPGFVGLVTFSYTVSDGHGYTATHNVYLNVTNTPPLGAADSYNVPINGLLQVTSAASGVLGNDSDADGDTLRAVLVSGPTKGTLWLNSNGTFTYRPNTGVSGIDTFTYRAFDGAQYTDPITVILNIV